MSYQLLLVSFCQIWGQISEDNSGPFDRHFVVFNGIVLSSLLISTITSSMSVRILDKHLHVARGKKVTGVLFEAS